MTDWTTPRTWTIGEKVTKAILDTHVRDNLNHLKEQLAIALLGGGATPLMLSVESVLFPNTDAAATITQAESSASVPKPNWLELLFADTPDQNVHWKRVLPDNLGSTATLRLYGYMESAGSGNIGFGCRVAAISVADASVDAKAFDSTNLASAAVPGSSKTKFILDITLTNKDSWAAGDEVVLDVYRNTAVAGNATGNCHITMAKLLFS